MTERNRLSLGGVWLIASLSALLLPVFIPSYPQEAGFFPNMIETSVETMFLLSLPISLVGFPLLLVVDSVLGINSHSISGMYTNLTMLFVLGVVQWFWIIPRIWFKDTVIQTLQSAIPEPMDAQLHDFDRFGARDRTPVERILDEE